MMVVVVVMVMIRGKGHKKRARQTDRRMRNVGCCPVARQSRFPLLCWMGEEQTGHDVRSMHSQKTSRRDESCITGR